jgi:hypothetical protein
VSEPTGSAKNALRDVTVVFPPDPLRDGLDFLERRLGNPELLRWLDLELKKWGSTLPRWVADTICGKLSSTEQALEAFSQNVTVRAIVTMLDQARRAEVLRSLDEIESAAVAFECGNVQNSQTSAKVRELRERVRTLWFDREKHGLDVRPIVDAEKLREFFVYELLKLETRSRAWEPEMTRALHDLIEKVRTR